MKKNCLGFTLVELLVVISILGVLSAVGLVTYSGTQIKARDGKRQQDLAQMQAALEQYQYNHGFYPYAWSQGQELYFGAGANKRVYLSKMPFDPKGGGGFEYIYNSVPSDCDNVKNTGKLCTGYQLKAKSEENVGQFYYVSSNNNVSLVAAVPTPLPVFAYVPGSAPTPTAGPTPTPTPVLYNKANGTACSANNECVSGNCYVDADGDFYAPQTGTKICRSTPQLAGVDCVDTRSDVYPGHTRYTIPAPNGEWDYDCTTLLNKRVFVTSNPTYDGNLGGLAGADQKCLDKANSNPDLCPGGCAVGSWKAWLSDNSTSPNVRFTKSLNEKYRMVNGEFLADNWDDLTNGSIGRVMTTAELGNEVAYTSIWTYTHTNGGVAGNGQNCNQWQSNSSALQGATGHNALTGQEWTFANYGQACSNNTFRLYCFEQ